MPTQSDLRKIGRMTAIEVRVDKITQKLFFYDNAPNDWEILAYVKEWRELMQEYKTLADSTRELQRANVELEYEVEPVTDKTACPCGWELPSEGMLISDTPTMPKPLPKIAVVCPRCKTIYGPRGQEEDTNDLVRGDETMKSPLTILREALANIRSDVIHVPPSGTGGVYHEELARTKAEAAALRSVLDGIDRTADNALYNSALAPGSVLQPWLEALPLKMQSTLLIGLRGPDDNAGRTPNIKTIIRWLRGLAFKPGDPANVEGFMGDLPPRIEEKGLAARELESCSQHFYSHLMHSLEVVGYNHPDPPTAKRALQLFDDMCSLLHLVPETRGAFCDRLAQKKWPGGVQPSDYTEAYKLIVGEAMEDLKKGEPVKLVDGFVSSARIDEAVNELRGGEPGGGKRERIEVSITKTATPEGMPPDSSPRIKVSGIATEAGVKIALHAAGTCNRETCPYCDVTRYREEFNTLY